jgi:hypothetical protein
MLNDGDTDGDRDAEADAETEGEIDSETDGDTDADTPAVIWRKHHWAADASGVLSGLHSTSKESPSASAAALERSDPVVSVPAIVTAGPPAGVAPFWRSVNT